MQTQKIASQLLQCCTPLMHAARWRALHDVTVSAINGRPLTLTGLALGTARTTDVRHRVKCVDRLLGNPHLKDERIEVYGALAHAWLSGLPHLLIVIDGSGLTADMRCTGCARPSLSTDAASRSMKKCIRASIWPRNRCTANL